MTKRTPWWVKKGLPNPATTTEVRNKISESRKGKPCGWIKKGYNPMARPEVKKKLSEKSKGQTPWWILRGLPNPATTSETKEKISKTRKGRGTWNKGLKGMDLSKGKGQFKKGHKRTAESIRKQSQAMKKRWQDKEYRENVISTSLKGLLKRPTSLERQMIRLIEQHNFPLEYTGNGAFLIGYKNPDFVETNGRKKCLEVTNSYFHDEKWVEQRRKHFRRWGWDCLVVMDYEMDKMEAVAKRISRWLEE